jgi:hypothetical protein
MKRESKAGGVAAAPELTKPEAAGEAEREALRAQNGVRLVTEEEEGFGLERLPPGVYGFTYSPGIANSPLFRKRIYHSLEVHKLPDSSVALIGFLPEKTAAKVEAGEEALDIRLFPEPDSEASQAVSIPLARVKKVSEFSMREAGRLALQLYPARRER